MSLFLSGLRASRCRFQKRLCVLPITAEIVKPARANSRANFFRDCFIR
jgi:hypothetical protein